LKCWLDYDQEELRDWPLDDTDGAYRVWNPDFIANETTEAFWKVRAFLKEKGLVI